jgi:ADP-ribose pyrophosphatase YjhB (NUDIX family)
MKDLSIIVEDGYKFNYRTAAMFLHNNKILVHKSLKSPFYTLPGGRVHVGENAIDGIKREVMEEIGGEVEYLGTTAIIENIFDLDDYHFHEILYVHKLKFVDENLYKEEIIHGVEGDRELNFIWANVEELNKVNLRPVCLKELIDGKTDGTQYIINYDK